MRKSVLLRQSGVALVCLSCGHGQLREQAGLAELVCESCSRICPVRDGVPRLVPGSLSGSQRRTADAFGWHGQFCAAVPFEHEQHFLDIIAPWRPDFFEGKVVLDAGCGTGRHAYLAATFGAREVWAMDFTDSVDAAHELLRTVPDACVIQGDLLRPPFAPGDTHSGFDIVYAIGVLHHLPDPSKGLVSLARLLRPGGSLFVWVYSHENSGVMRTLVEPLRRLTTRLPPFLLRLLAWPLALTLHVAVKLRTQMHTMRAGGSPPFQHHLATLSGYHLRRNFAVVLDQLVAPTTRYISEAELRRWLEAAGLERPELSLRNGNSWRASARRPA